MREVENNFIVESERLKNQIEEMKVARKSLEPFRSEQKLTLKQLEESKREVDGKYTRLEKVMKSELDAFNTSQNKVDNYQKEISKLNLEIQRMENAEKESKKHHEKELVFLNTEIESLREILAELEKTIKTEKETLNSLKSTMSKRLTEAESIEKEALEIGNALKYDRALVHNSSPSLPSPDHKRTDSSDSSGSSTLVNGPTFGPSMVDSMNMEFEKQKESIELRRAELYQTFLAIQDENSVLQAQLSDERQDKIQMLHLLALAKCGPDVLALDNIFLQQPEKMVNVVDSPGISSSWTPLASCRQLASTTPEFLTRAEFVKAVVPIEDLKTSRSGSLSSGFGTQPKSQKALRSSSFSGSFVHEDLQERVGGFVVDC
ncbi:hypothetical protein HK096_010979 [Nowakowskiella sp. JEL0078]|nr:hypothetical protein HK096_010979 [Nowakowskiella sp. JEL0078]